MSLQSKIDACLQEMLKYGFPADVGLLAEAKIIEKPFWMWQKNRTFTPTKGVVMLGRTWKHQTLVERTATLINEATHLGQYEMWGPLSFYTRYVQKEGRYDIEVASTMSEITYRVRRGLIKRPYSGAGVPYVNNATTNFGKWYGLGDWYYKDLVQVGEKVWKTRQHILYDNLIELVMEVSFED